MTSARENLTVTATALSRSDDSILDFFHEESLDIPRAFRDDSASINSTRSRLSTIGAFAPLRRTLTQESLDSIDVSEVRIFGLGDLCNFIKDHPSLRSAGIISCSCYAQPSRVLSFIPHRFLILQLRRQGRSDIWLRLDRRPSAQFGPAAFALAFGVTPSNDSAMLASSPEQLFTSLASCENEIVFDSPYPLEGLRLRLLAILQVMGQYKLSSENCWAFCSLLQENLSLHQNAPFRTGSLNHSRLARQARVRVGKLLVKLFLSPRDPDEYTPFSTLLRTLQPSPLEVINQAFVQRVRDAATMAESWEDSDGFNSLEGRLAVANLLAWLHLVSSAIYADPNSKVAVQTSTLCRHVLTFEADIIIRELDAKSPCLLLLIDHAKAYMAIRSFEEALPVYQEVISFIRPHERIWAVYLFCYYYYPMALHEAGRAGEASEPVSAFVDGVRRGSDVSVWSTQIERLRMCGMWPVEFEYLISLERGDLYIIPNWPTGASP